MSPEIAVVVASHDRPLRLGWLLEALSEQTLVSAACRARAEHFSRDRCVDRYRSLYQDIRAAG